MQRLLSGALRRLSGLHTAASRSPTLSPKPSLQPLLRPFTAAMSMPNRFEALSGSPHSFANFDLIKRIKLKGTDTIVSKWQSRVTGLTIVHLDYQAPLVGGHFVVATEIFDDTGCPHTLEHLVFMGSEKYPYKDVIDRFANRGFSVGTNAWTVNDHTAYTSSTAGDQGFLQLLPVYVDHILYPTMTNSAFLTEVHHINGKGEDAGVVYSEMQGRQNTADDRMALCSQRTMYPVGSGYRTEFAGLMEALRTLTVEQIRIYHGTYYVPHNLTLIVAGKLSGGTTSLLSVVQDQVEPSIIAHGQNRGTRPDGWKRPFLETFSAEREPIQQTIKKVVDFPEKDESQGMLFMTFTGPSPTNFLERKALDVLSVYLTSSPVAPLDKEYIEIESPLCSNIYFGEDVRATMVDIPISIHSIPLEYIDDFDKKLVDSFRRIAKEGIDMSRMSITINRDERQLRSKLEFSKEEVLAPILITDFLYGAPDGSDLPPALNDAEHYSILRTWTSDDWSNLLKKYFIDPCYVAIVGKPSANLADKLEKDEEVRLATQRVEFGPKGLENAERRLQAAKAEHEKVVPKDVLLSFPVPDVKSIFWIDVESVQEKGRSLTDAQGSPSKSGLAEHIERDGSPLSMFVQFDNVKSDFVSIHACFSLATVSNRLRPYISTYIAAFFSLPVKCASGEYLSHEEVTNRLDSETVDYDISTDITSGQFTEVLRVSLQVQATQYEFTVAWLRDLIWGAVFDPERLHISAAKVAQSLPELKRDGSSVLDSVWLQTHFDSSSTNLASTVLPQSQFILKLIADLRETPEKVVADFEELRQSLTSPSGIRFSVGGDVLGVEKPRSAWQKHLGGLLQPSELAPVKLTCQTLNELGKSPAGKATIVSLPTTESSFVNHTAKGIQGFNHPEFPALRIALETLNRKYLWESIRGAGLAYGADIRADKESGLLIFSLYRSSNPMAAFTEVSKVITGLVDGTIELDQLKLDEAKSSIVYNAARNVGNPSMAAMNSFLDQAIKGLPAGHNLQLLEEYQAVTKEEVLTALKNYVVPLFSSSSSTVVVVTAPSKVDEIARELEGHGFKTEKRTLEVESDDTGSESGDSWETDENKSDVRRI